jgi:hypothetical protein
MGNEGMTVTTGSTVRLHPLLFRQEDPGEWVVGRADTGEFVVLPDMGVTFLHALDGDPSIVRAHECVRRRHGQDIDAADFVDTLIDLGFVASLDGQPMGPAPKPPSLPWLQPRHVRWVFRWPALVCIYGLVVAGLIAAAVRGDLIPSYRVFFITGSPSVNLVWNTAMIVAAIALHEFWHLAAARASDVYGRIGLGTRLQFLVAQTKVTGLWASPRHVRIRVYLAGVTSDLAIIGACSLAITIAAPTGLAYRALEALTLGLLLSVANQFMLYMKTDMYFVLQEVLRCKNLYADAWDYVRYIIGGAFAVVLRKQPPADPTRSIPYHERPRIKVYSGLMMVGSLITIALFAFYEGPILITLFVRAGQDALDGITSGNFGQALDGITVFGIEGTVLVVFLCLFFAKHAAKLRRLLGSSGRKAESAPAN